MLKAKMFGMKIAWCGRSLREFPLLLKVERHNSNILTQTTGSLPAALTVAKLSETIYAVRGAWGSIQLKLNRLFIEGWNIRMAQFNCSVKHLLY